MRALGRLAGRALFGWLLACFVLSAIIPYEAWATPMVAITRPTNGAVVKAEVWVDAVYQSSTKDPIVRLELLVDGAVVRKYVLPTPRLKGEASFSYSFKTETGELHRISVRAIDSTGATGEASINVQVKKVTGPSEKDVTPPIVNIYYPHEGQQVSGTCEIKVDARDNVGVEWVFIYLDGKIKAMIKGNPPYNDRWDTTKVTDGIHVLQAKAWDAAENEGTSAPVKVTVANRKRTLPMSTRRETAPAPRPSGRESVVPPAPVASAPPVPASPAPQRAVKPPAAATSGSTVGGAARPAVTGQAAQPGRTPATAPAPVAPQPVERKHTVAAKPKPSAPAPPAVPSAIARSEVAALPASRATTVALAQPAGGRAVTQAPSPKLRPAQVGATVGAEPVASVTRGRAVASVAPRSVRPIGADVSVAYRVDSPIAGLVRTVVPPVLQASWPKVRARAGARRPEAAMAPAAGARASAPPKPAVVAGASARVTALPQATTAAVRTAPQGSSARAAHPSARRAMAPARKPRACAPGRQPQPDLVPRAAEVYLLAMVPRPGVAPLDGQKSTAPGKAARRPGLVNISPVALSRFRDVKIVYDGKLVPLRACPEVVKGIPVGPLREVFEQADGVLFWYPVQKRVKAVKPGLTLELQIGNRRVRVNSQLEELCLAPYIKRGRTMVPLEFLAQTLNVTITFDSKKGQLIISSNDL